MQIIEIKNKKDLEKLAKSFSKDLETPVILALTGDLGSGKTTFTQYLAKYLNIDFQVKSPTFTIHREHTIRNSKTMFHHIDLFRIEFETELNELNIEKMLDHRDILVIEWSDRFESQINKLAKKSKIIHLLFEHKSENERTITIY